VPKNLDDQVKNFPTVNPTNVCMNDKRRLNIRKKSHWQRPHPVNGETVASAQSDA
jgi:hypothetical protein